MNTDFINLADYPIDQPQSRAYQSLVEKWRQRLTDTGLINLDDFLTPAGVAQMRQEVYLRESDAFHSVHGAQAYFDNFPGEIPEGALGSNTYALGHHNLHDTAMDALFRWQPVRRFVAALTGHDEVYLHEDPTNAVVVQLYKPGCWTGWHFDRANFTTIINLGVPDGGGVFECAADVRTEDDPRYSDVGDVLMKRAKTVQRHEMRAGSFTLMYGRYSLHRVTEIAEGADRISLVLKYETQPGVSISTADRRMIYGPDVPDGPAQVGKIATNSA